MRRRSRDKFPQQATPPPSYSFENNGIQIGPINMGTGSIVTVGDRPVLAQPQPMPSSSEGGTTKLAEVRRLLVKILRTDSDFDAFCLDHFREVFNKFSSGIDRVHKCNLLLAMEPAHRILRALGKYSSEMGESGQA